MSREIAGAGKGKGKGKGKGNFKDAVPPEPSLRTARA